MISPHKFRLAQWRWQRLTVGEAHKRFGEGWGASSSDWQMSREIAWIDRMWLLLLRLQIHGCLFLFVSVVITQAPTRAAGSGECGGRGDESSSKTRTRTKPGKTERGGQMLKRQAMTDSLSPLFYSAARSFLGFVLSALPSLNPHTHTPTPLEGTPHDLCPGSVPLEPTRRLKADTLCLRLCNQPTCLVLERPFKPLFSSPVGLFAFEGKVTFGWMFHIVGKNLTNCATSKRSNWGLSLNASQATSIFHFSQKWTCLSSLRILIYFYSDIHPYLILTHLILKSSVFFVLLFLFYFFSPERFRCNASV